MSADGHDFLAELAGFPPNTFEGRFLKTSNQLGLGALLNGNELGLLHRAAFLAALCHIAFNGLGGCRGGIRPEREVTRTMLERAFMAARAEFFASPGWKDLPSSKQGLVQRMFLTVAVAEENLVW